MVLKILRIIFLIQFAHSKTFDLPEDYDSQIPPWTLTDTNEIYVVDLSIAITKIPGINEEEQSVHIEAFLRMMWRDHRLSYNESILNGTGKDYLSIGDSSPFWIPDLYISNAREIMTTEFQVTPESFRIQPDGRVRTSKAINVDFSCNMDFRNFPFDEQNCEIDFESYDYTSKEMKFYLNKSMVDVRNGTQGMNRFYYNVEVIPDMVIKYDGEYGGGEFSRSRLVMKFERKIAFYGAHVYFPSILFVILAWLALFIPMDFVPGRLVTKVTLLLTLTGMYDSIAASTPPVSYLTKLDIWIIVCLLHVFFVLVEYPIVLALKHFAESEKIKQKEENLKRTAISNKIFPTEEREHPKSYFDALKYAHNMEARSKIIYTISFIIFNIAYWLFIIEE